MNVWKPFLLAGLFAAACADDPAPAATPADTDSGLVLAADPGDAISVADLRETGDGESAVVVGRVRDIVTGFASFRLIDESLAYCGQTGAEKCATPWDYCCLAESAKTPLTIVVEARDAQGEVIETESLPGLRHLDLVAIRGRVARDEHGNTTLVADGWYRRERPTLHDGVRWP